MNKYMSPYKYRIHLYVTFKDLFPEEPEINVKDILSHYSRKSLINVALALDTYYGEGEFEKCIHFFSERKRRVFSSSGSGRQHSDFGKKA